MIRDTEAWSSGTAAANIFLAVKDCSCYLGKMNVAFYLSDYNERGVVRSTIDFAHYNERILGNTSVIVAPDSTTMRHSKISRDPTIMEQFIRRRFKVITHKPSKNLEQCLSEANADFFYVQKSGHRDGIVSERVPTGIHVVFRDFHPHGHKYFYISEWLAKEAATSLHQETIAIPLMVSGPRKPKTVLRRKLGIPPEATVIGRYGGYHSFDIPYVYEAIKDILKMRPDWFFVFVNTRPFYQHPRIQYLDTMVSVQEKVDYIHACDAMLHARKLGESFGLSIAEFLYQGKPIFSCAIGRDTNHHAMLGDQGLWYTDKDMLMKQFLRFQKHRHDPAIYKKLAEKFHPTVVMPQFQEKILT